jgi:RNA polymerase sigma factor (sigma-70 family)
MNCTGCGKQISGTEELCPRCGAAQATAADKAEQTDKNEVVLLIQKAMRGDDSVWGAVYEKTYRYVYYMAFKFLRSEQDAQDITQEVYIQVIRSIGQLYSADSFFGWLRTIVYSKCKDLVKKKKPILLDEDGATALEETPDLTEEFLPHSVLDKAETRRMVLELVDALPYLQRQAVMFYYFDEMTVDQIASLMECSSGTVKSRLNYARQTIKKGVEEHERKGIKLYGVGAVPILAILLREQARAMLIPEAVSKGILPILSSSAHIASGSANASLTAAKSTTGLLAKIKAAPLFAKIIAGIVAAGIVIGGIVTPIILSQRDTPTTPESEIPSISSPSAQPNEQKYMSLTDAQRLLLERLSTATINNDYESAYEIYGSQEMDEIIALLPTQGERDGILYPQPGSVLLNNNAVWQLEQWTMDETPHIYFFLSPNDWNNSQHYSSGYWINSNDGINTYSYAYTMSVQYKDGKANGECKSFKYAPDYADLPLQISVGMAANGVREGEWESTDYYGDGRVVVSIMQYSGGKPVSFGISDYDGSYIVSKDKKTGEPNGYLWGDDINRIHEIY